MKENNSPCPFVQHLKQLRQGCFMVAKIHLLSERVLSWLIKKHGLDKEVNPAQGRILFALWQGDGISIGELAEKTSLDKSTLTSMLDRLEKNGFIVRVPSTDDRRKILIKLTEKDRSLQDIYTQITTEKSEQFYKGFTSAEIEQFENYLGRVLENVSSFEKEK